ncbi:inorganic phosphate transporter [bacterium]|nr:inorganic phosphate transporter [bacterium]
MELLVFLSSGLFLGWSLGANDAANVFGTAVGARMVRFRTAALVCSVFLVLGATISGAGAAHTLGKLGAVNALGGAFAVALAAGLTTFVMTRLRMPVSTSQAIVGAILGWNLYTASLTDAGSLANIVLVWVVCPVLSGVVAIGLFVLVRLALRLTRPHLLRLDAGTRLGLLVVGAFGSYSLGANNIANVMGVFVPDNPFHDVTLFGWLPITGVQQLFGLGALAIAVGVFTYSRQVMGTVGSGLARVSPVPALVIVLAHSITLFVFASQGLRDFLLARGLPALPLVPVSSSQAVIGAVVGLSLFKGIGVRLRILGEISLGWVATPVAACAVAGVLLFALETVFDQPVQRGLTYRIDGAVAAELARRGLDDPGLGAVPEAEAARPFAAALREHTSLQGADVRAVVRLAATGRWRIEAGRGRDGWSGMGLSPGQIDALDDLEGAEFEHAWQVSRALAHAGAAWRPLPATPANRRANEELARQAELVERISRVD